MSDLLRRPSKQTQTFLELSWGFPDNPTYLRVWDGTHDQVFKGFKYFSVPSMEFEIAEQGLTFDDQPSLIRLPNKSNVPLVQSLVDDLKTGRPFSRIRCKVFEAVDYGNVVHLANGFIESADSGSLSSNAAALEMELMPPFGGLEQSAGLLALATCSSPYLGQGCFKPFTTAGEGVNPLPSFPDAARVAVQFSSISGLDVTLVPDSGAVPNSWIEGFPDFWWSRGSLDADGISIPIASWEVGTRNFRLENFLPAGWGIGNRAVFLYPGCGKTPTDCFRRQNLEHFTAFGIATPSVNPILELDDRQ